MPLNLSEYQHSQDTHKRQSGQADVNTSPDGETHVLVPEFYSSISLSTSYWNLDFPWLRILCPRNQFNTGAHVRPICAPEFLNFC